MFDPRYQRQPGAASGRVVFTPEEAEAWAADGKTGHSGSA